MSDVMVQVTAVQNTVRDLRDWQEFYKRKNVNVTVEEAQWPKGKARKTAVGVILKRALTEKEIAEIAAGKTQIVNNGLRYVIKSVLTGRIE